MQDNTSTPLPHTLGVQLLNQYRQGKLGHIYLWHCIGEEQRSHSYLSQEVHYLLESLHLSETDPDVLWIRPPETQSTRSDYTVHDLKEYFHFLMYKPFKQHRFIVLESCHLLTETLINKLLKSFEEPPPQKTIILLRPNAQKLLPTLLSRVILQSVTLSHLEHLAKKEYSDNLAAQFTLSKKQWFTKKLSSIDPSEFPEKLKNSLLNYIEHSTGTFDFISSFKDHPQAESTFFNLVVEWESNRISSYKEKVFILQQIHWFQHSKSIHNSPGERIYSLLMCLNH